MSEIIQSVPLQICFFRNCFSLIKYIDGILPLRRLGKYMYNVYAQELSFWQMDHAHASRF